MMQPTFTRRTVLVATGSAATLGGCLGGGSEQSAPRDLEYELRLTQSNGTVELAFEPQGEVADVIQINVGDAVTFTILNQADVPIGFHNHANDAEVVVQPGKRHEMAFEATEAMTGRQEIEGWVAEGDYGEGRDEDEQHGDVASTIGVIEVRPRGS